MPLEEIDHSFRIHRFKSTVQKSRIADNTGQEIVPAACICKIASALARNIKFFLFSLVLLESSDRMALLRDQDRGHHAGRSGANDSDIAQSVIPLT